MPRRSTLTLSAPAVFSAPASARRRLDPAVDHGDRARAGGAHETVDELVGAPEVDAVGEPEQFHVGGRGQEAADHRQRLGAVDRVRLRPDLPEPHADASPAVSSEMSRPVSDNGTRATPRLVGLRARDEVLRGADAPVPGRRRRPAVVDHQHERRDAADEVAIGGFHIGPAAARINSAARRKPQQQQPPRRARGRLLLRRDVEQETRRREVDAARARRDEPQQPPQHRQAEHPEQHQRLGEGERKPHHAQPPRCRERVPAIDAGAAAGRLPCANAATAGGRWPGGRCGGSTNDQPRRSVSARISAR